MPRVLRRGDFRNCQNLKVCGISYDGGYQQYMIAPVEALVAIPDGLNDAEAACRCSVRALPLTTHCGIAVRCPETWLRCRVSEAWDISAFNSRISLVIRWPRSGVGLKNAALAKGNWEPACTSTVKRPRRRKMFAKARRRAGDFGDCAKLEGDVGID